MQDNFGYSLLASYCDEFVFEFVLHGTSDKSFLNDLNERLVFSKQVSQQSTFLTQNFFKKAEMEDQ